MDCFTKRLRIREFTYSDAGFIVQLLNQESFIDNIADKGVRTKEDAIAYLDSGPFASYREFGFGLSLVELRESNQSIGMCGLLKRPELEEVDIGYALLDQYAGKGYALEAASETIAVGHQSHQLKKIAAVTSPDNSNSIRLLEKLGFKFKKMIQFYDQPTRYFEKVSSSL